MTDHPVRLRPEIAALPAYRQGKHAGDDAFKLSSNENPFEPLPGVVEAVQASVGFNRYPDASAARLRARLAEKFGVTDDAVHIAAGSVSILFQLAQGLGQGTLREVHGLGRRPDGAPFGHLDQGAQLVVFHAAIVR